MGSCFSLKPSKGKECNTEPTKQPMRKEDETSSSLAYANYEYDRLARYVLDFGTSWG